MSSSAETLSQFKVNEGSGITKSTSNQDSNLVMRARAVHSDFITLNGATVTLTANGTASGGSLTLGVFPAGLLQMIGGVGSLTLTPVTTNASTVSSTMAIVASVGTALPAAAGSTSTGTAANLIQSTAFTLVAGTKSASLIATVSPTLVDGTTLGGAPKSAIINITMPNTNLGTMPAIVISGLVKIAWMQLADI